MARICTKGLPAAICFSMCASQCPAGAAALNRARHLPARPQSLCPALLERFKEKNIVMSKAVEESLRTLAKHCFTLADVTDDVAAALDHKNPKGECLRSWASGMPMRSLASMML